MTKSELTAAAEALEQSKSPENWATAAELRKSSKWPFLHGHRVGGKRSPTLSSWSAMRTRCLISTTPDYLLYGARGIKICERWNSFDAFLADMGERPLGTSLDRIDSNGDYEPSNCRWVDLKTQVRNRRVTVRFSYKGETKSMADWAEQIGIGYRTLQNRIAKRKWSVEKALTTPVKKGWNSHA